MTSRSKVKQPHIWQKWRNSGAVATITPTNQDDIVITRKHFFDLAEKIVLHSNGRIRVAFNEEHDSSIPDMQAAHFLKLDGHRIGRDLEVYGFMAKVEKEIVLPDFFENLLRIKRIVPESYYAVVDEFKELGRKVYNGEILEDWFKLFVEDEATTSVTT